MNEAISYVYDFLSMVFEIPELKGEIKEIILFGSVAKGAHDKKSDIDLFFNVSNKTKIENIEIELKRVLKSFEIKVEKTWALKKIRFPISIIAGNLEEEEWRALKEEIISSGIMLYGHYKELPKDTAHHYIVYYSLTKLNRKDKMKFIRAVFGYKIRKGKKEYAQKGILDEVAGFKLAPNAILIPSESIQKIKGIFKKFNLEYRIIEAWIRK